MRADYYSVGFLREDYDFEIMATISNGGGVMGNSGFDILLENTLKICQSLAPEQNVVALPRQDTPDVLSFDDDELREHFNIDVSNVF
jgi:hypothetical protein